MREFISDDRVAAFVSQRTGISLAKGQYTQLGVLENDKLTAGIVFNHYTGCDITVTVAADHPRAFTKTFLTRVGHYLFHELNCVRISVLTEQPNVVALAIRLGAAIEGTKRDQFGIGRDAVLLGLLARDWPFSKRLNPPSS